MDKLSKALFSMVAAVFIIFTVIVIGAIYIFQQDELLSEDNSMDPPTAKLIINNEEYILRLSAHKWKVGNSISENKNINVYAFGQKESPIQLKKEQTAKLRFIQYQEFHLKEIKIYLWKNEKHKEELTVKENNTFMILNSPGNYVLELKIKSNLGNAQYIRNIAII
ncbi:hypothetical protein [Saccharococcus thermophilus]|uniref:Uncharacterized protein n=1 Tax=Saccharococcus thermophilus TaxID=29396 RepID=A0A846MDH5_9BACL|nr:hypothetical protein [Saccharococcus thermophilus]NIK14938.1 hypothetical protein [Saccharococcus thermophilus]